MKKILGGSFVLILVLVLLLGCNGREEKTGGKSSKNIKIGCMPITESIIDFASEEMAKDGYVIEKVLFDGAHLPATTLNDGSIDGFVLNHLQWVEVFNEKNNANLKMVQPYIYYFRNGVFSSKHNSIDELPEKAVVAIPGDPDNMDRSLKVLQKIGLIKLADKEGMYTLIDIEENYKDIQILETEITSTVKSLHDVDMIISGANSMRLAGEDYENNFFIDSVDEEYPISITVRNGDEEKEWVKAFMEVSRTKTFMEKFNEYYKGTFILYED